MRSIRYIGPSNVRVVRATDFTSAGITQADVTFNLANQYQQSVPDNVAAFLLAIAPNDFVDTGGIKFNDLVAGSGREVAYSEFLGVLVTSTSLVDLGLSVTATHDGIKPWWIEFGFLGQINIGTAPAGSTINAQVQVFDETNLWWGTAAVRTRVDTVVIATWRWRRRLGILAAGTQHTWRLQGKVDTAGASMQLFPNTTSGQNPYLLIEAK